MLPFLKKIAKAFVVGRRPFRTHRLRPSDVYHLRARLLAQGQLHARHLLDVRLQFLRRRLFGHRSIGCNDNRIVALSVAKQVVVGQCPRAEGKGDEEGCEAEKHSGKGNGVFKDQVLPQAVV